MQAIRLLPLLLQVVVGGGLSFAALVPALAAPVCVELCSGPSYPFPVVYEVTSDRNLDVILRRGDWVKATNGV